MSKKEEKRIEKLIKQLFKQKKKTRQYENTMGDFYGIRNALFGIYGITESMMNVLKPLLGKIHDFHLYQAAKSQSIEKEIVDKIRDILFVNDKNKKK